MRSDHNPFGPGGAYSGGMFAANIARNPNEATARRLSGLKQAIFIAIREFNLYRQQINAAEAFIRIVEFELEPELWKAIKAGQDDPIATEMLESTPNPFEEYPLAQLLGWAEALGLPATQIKTLSKYIEVMKENASGVHATAPDQHSDTDATTED